MSFFYAYFSDGCEFFIFRPDFVAFFEIVYAVFFEKFSHGFVYYFHASGVEHAACVEDYEFYHGCFWCWLRANCFSTAPHAGFMDFAVRFLL